uniref:MD-2-related lipid-recognition domain-containing protein n=1 Tax=Plectus sambesii TaxID=2011161 RepID=A0A914X4S3_9BILA
MFSYFIAFAAVVAVVFCSPGPRNRHNFADCPAFPNKTDIAPTWWQCTQGLAITTNTATPSFLNGTAEYPIHLSAPVLITTDIVNSGPALSSLLADISLWEWGGWLGCSWHSFPTFGLLGNINACTHGTPCPIPAGASKMKTVIDFTPYSAIIKLLKNAAPYQIEYSLKDHSNGDKVVSCIMFQSEALIQ